MAKLCGTPRAEALQAVNGGQAGFGVVEEVSSFSKRRPRRTLWRFPKAVGGIESQPTGQARLCGHVSQRERRCRGCRKGRHCRREPLESARHHARAMPPAPTTGSVLRPVTLSGDQPAPVVWLPLDNYRRELGNVELGGPKLKRLLNNAGCKTENGRVRKRKLGVDGCNPHGCTRHPKWIMRTGESRSM